MRVNLPDDLGLLLKACGSPASELLQKAVWVELRGRDLLAETDRQLADLVTQVGTPSADQRARAVAVARRIARRPILEAG